MSAMLIPAMLAAALCGLMYLYMESRIAIMRLELALASEKAKGQQTQGTERPQPTYASVAATPAAGRFISARPQRPAASPPRVHRGPGAPAPFGHTTDPVSGRVFRVTAPKDRSEAFVTLHGQYESARRALARYMRTMGYSHDLSNEVTLDSQGQEVTSDGDLRRLLGNLSQAKLALAAYKAAHRGEFRHEAGPNRSVRQRRSRVSVPVLGIGGKRRQSWAEEVEETSGSVAPAGPSAQVATKS